MEPETGTTNGNKVMSNCLRMKIRNILLGGIAVIAFSSCENLFLEQPGKAIVFAVSAEDTVPTKTEYSGEVVGGKERINWVLGDQVMIYMHSWTNETPSDKNQAYYIKGIHIGDQNEGESDRRESHGSLATLNKNDQLSWDGTDQTTYEFYSVYPAELGDLPKRNHNDRGNYRLVFSLPSKQYANLEENMQHYAYMAATSTQETYTKGQKGTVELRYYPMVTTFYITLTNDTTKEINLKEVTLSTNSTEWFNNWYQGILAGGEYGAKLVGNRFEADDYPWSTGGDNKVRLTFEDKKLSAGASIDAAIFVRPRLYKAENLDFEIKMTTGAIKNSLSNKRVSAFEPCKKYNIKVNLSGEGTTIDPPIDPDAPPVYPSSDGAAQLLLLLMQSGQFKEVYQELFGNNAPTGFTDFNDFWNHCYLDKFINSTFYVDDPMKHMKELFPEEIFKTLGVLCNMLTDLILPDVSSAGITKSVDAKAFKMFPNVRTISLYIDQTAVDECSISIDGLESLQSITIEHPRKVDIKNCGNLTTVTLRNSDSRTNLNVDKATCPKYQG